MIDDVFLHRKLLLEPGYLHETEFHLLILMTKIIDSFESAVFPAT